MEFIIGIKPAPGDHESNFKKVGSIPFWFITMGTDEKATLYVFVNLLISHSHTVKQSSSVLIRCGKTYILIKLKK